MRALGSFSERRVMAQHREPCCAVPACCPQCQAALGRTGCGLFPEQAGAIPAPMGSLCSGDPFGRNPSGGVLLPYF